MSGIFITRPDDDTLYPTATASWGGAGEYTMLAEVAGDDGRVAANSLASTQVWVATIIGPALAGVLLADLAPAWLLGFDAATFAVLGAQVCRIHTDPARTDQLVDTRATESGFHLLRRSDLLGLIVLTWLFSFLYGPVETALPIYVAHLHVGAGLLGAYWTSFGIGAVVSTLLAGTLRYRAARRIILVIVAGWGACLLPFAFAPTAVTLVCFAAGGLVYGPFTPVTYALFQSITTTANLLSVLAAQRGTDRRRSSGHRARRPDHRQPRRTVDADRLRRRHRPARRGRDRRLATRARHAHRASTAPWSAEEDPMSSKAHPPAPRELGGDRQRILALFAPYRWRLVAVLALIVLGAILSVINPFLVKDVLDQGILPPSPDPAQ